MPTTHLAGSFVLSIVPVGFGTGPTGVTVQFMCDTTAKFVKNNFLVFVEQ